VKPAPFEYEDPSTLPEALSLLAEHGDAATVLAGGQSLVPLLNFRLSQPERVIDINGLSELDYIRVEDCALRIGALTRQATLERSPEVAARVPLLSEVVRFVGHAAIRTRGTVGGSVAHADPAAELPVTFATLDARFHLRAAAGARCLPAEEFFRTVMMTARKPDELLVEVEVPLPSERTRSGFAEFAKRNGDFALAGVAAVLRVSPDGRCEEAALGLLGAAPVPLRSRVAEEYLRGTELDTGTLAEAARLAAREVRAGGDIHASAEYRANLVEAMAGRALTAAAARS
jgi:CO/xanthine dehydrogenase FAD-binding subunit